MRNLARQPLIVGPISLFVVEFWTIVIIGLASSEYHMELLLREIPSTIRLIEMRCRLIRANGNVLPASEIERSGVATLDGHVQRG